LQEQTANSDTFIRIQDNQNQLRKAELRFYEQDNFFQSLISAEMHESEHAEFRKMGNLEEAHTRGQNSVPARTLQIRSDRKGADPADIGVGCPRQDLVYCVWQLNADGINSPTPAT